MLTFPRSRFLPSRPPASYRSFVLTAICAFFFALQLPSPTCAAEPEGSIIPVGPGFRAGSSQTVGLFPGMDNDSFECSSPPTPDEVKAAKFSTTLAALTAEQAGELKLSFAGSGSAKIDSNQQIIVSQTGQWKPCLAKDGQTRLLYGHLVRTTVILSNYKVEGELSLAVVAAQATIKGASNRVELEAIGIPDVEVQEKLQEAKNSLGGLSLKVENYQEFDKKRGEAELAAVKSKEAGSELVGVVGELLDETALKVIIARALAIQYIAWKYDCDDAVKRYGTPRPEEAAAIRETYNRVAGGCKPSGEAAERAKRILGNVSIK
jgi:hypothetical protein